MASQPDISYVLNARWPTIRAYGLQVAKVCQGFKQAGAKVRLVVPRRAEYPETKGKDPFAFYGIRDRYRVIRLPSVDVLDRGWDGKRSFAFQQALFAVLVAAYLAFRPGIIYSRDPFTLYFLSFMRHNLFWELHRMPERPESATYRRLFRKVRGFIAITEGIADALEQQGIPRSRILIAPDGVDVQEMKRLPHGPELQSSLGLDPDRHIAGYVGSLLEWKGVDTFVKAAQLLDERFQIFIVGGTSEDIRRLRALDPQERIRWVGYVPHADALRWIAAADTMVLPNRKDAGISEKYTSPLKMFEYMAAGKRIVASDLPSIREVLNDGNAFLVRPDDPAELAAGIRRAAEDEEEAERRAQRAASDVRQYAWDARARKVLDFIAAS